jgi:hypothetical protein
MLQVILKILQNNLVHRYVSGESGHIGANQYPNRSPRLDIYYHIQIWIRYNAILSTVTI